MTFRKYEISKILKAAKSEKSKADGKISVTFPNSRKPKKEFKIDKSTLFQIQRDSGDINYAFNLKGKGVYYIGRNNQAFGPISRFRPIQEAEPGHFFICLNVKDFLPYAKAKAEQFNKPESAKSIGKLIEDGLDNIFVKVSHDGYNIIFKDIEFFDALKQKDMAASELLPPEKLKCAIEKMYGNPNPLREIQEYSENDFDAVKLASNAITIPNNLSILMCLG